MRKRRHPGQPRRAAIYARVSTARDQDPTMQLEVLREFAARRRDPNTAPIRRVLRPEDMTVKELLQFDKEAQRIKDKLRAALVPEEEDEDECEDEYEAA